MLNKFGSALCAVLIVIGFGGCAYRVGSVAGKNLQGVTSVYVPVVKNESYEPSMQVMVTNAIIRRFDNDGTLKTTSALTADGQLDVVIKKVDQTTIRGDRLDPLATAQYQVTIYAEATFFNRKLGRKTLNAAQITGTAKYFVQANQQESERQTLPTAAEDLAQNIVALITEGW